MADILRRFIYETLYRLMAPKRYNLPPVEVEADNTRDAGVEAAKKYSDEHGVKGIDPFSLDIEVVPGGKGHNPFSKHVKPCPPRIKKLIKDFAAARGLSYEDDYVPIDAEYNLLDKAGIKSPGWSADPAAEEEYDKQLEQAREAVAAPAATDGSYFVIAWVPEEGKIGYDPGIIDPDRAGDFDFIDEAEVKKMIADPNYNP